MILNRKDYRPIQSLSRFYANPLKMKLLSTLLIIPSLSFGQIMIGELTQGENFNEVVYEGTYFSQGGCVLSVNDFDFAMDFTGLGEIDGMEYAFVVDAPSPPSTTLSFLGQAVNTGDSTTFNSATDNVGITAGAFPLISPPAQLNFHIRLLGTPTSAGQIYPCWIDQFQTLADCQNNWILLDGESLIPCEVQTIEGINNQVNSTSIYLRNNQLIVESASAGILTLIAPDGRLTQRSELSSGTSSIQLDSYQGLVLARFNTKRMVTTKKLMVQ